MSCRDARFLRYLRDLLVSEVIQLNSVQFDMGDNVSRLEDSLDIDNGGGYNELLVETFQETVITLRILAKVNTHF